MNLTPTITSTIGLKNSFRKLMLTSQSMCPGIFIKSLVAEVATKVQGGQSTAFFNVVVCKYKYYIVQLYKMS